MTLALIRGGYGMTVAARHDELAMEGIAACDDAIGLSQQIALAAANGSPMLVVDLCNRMAFRLTASRAEIRRLAGDPESAA